ncbi:hypothetical protein SBRCBS47491_009128 [Sporothrix bragantina]|uniref:Cupin type-1 domain-containing protein n=1 Tax=Sporothrix bragantina TaxID=671064 RepID=A0ABP0CTN9_9PEZI
MFTASPFRASGVAWRSGVRTTVYSAVSQRLRQRQHRLVSTANPSLPFVVRPQDVTPYSPANHTGTVNRRLIDPVTVGSQSIELLHGTLSALSTEKARAAPHYHANMDQVCYILAGRALCRTLVPSNSNKNGEPPAEGADMWREQIIEKGDACFFARGVVHEVVALGGDEVLSQDKGSSNVAEEDVGKLKLLVMYSPPYMEDPANKTIVWTGKMK